MNRVFSQLLVVLIVIPMSSIAQEAEALPDGQPLWVQLLVATFPIFVIIILIILWIVVSKYIAKYTHRLYKTHHDKVEENLTSIAKSLEKLANDRDKT